MVRSMRACALAWAACALSTGCAMVVVGPGVLPDDDDVPPAAPQVVAPPAPDPPRLSRCDGFDVDLTVSNEHCGGCNRTCFAPAACLDGRCVDHAGQTLCGASWVDLRDDTHHCGACGVACAPRQRCLRGRCG